MPRTTQWAVGLELGCCLTVTILPLSIAVARLLSLSQLEIRSWWKPWVWDSSEGCTESEEVHRVCHDCICSSRRGLLLYFNWQWTRFLDGAMATWCAMVHSWCHWKRFDVPCCDLRFESGHMIWSLTSTTAHVRITSKRRSNMIFRLHTWTSRLLRSVIM